MATKTEPSPENPFAGFDPSAAWAQSRQIFQQAIADALGRTQAVADQVAAIEAQMVARAQGAIASWAQLTHEAIAYAAQLSAEARRLGLDAIRKASAAA